MKHTLKVTIALILFFFTAQIVGLLTVNSYIDHKKTAETHVVEYKSLPYNIERPRVENPSNSWIYISLAIFVGTMLILLLIKLNKPFIWKAWVFVTILITLSIALSGLMMNISIWEYAAMALSGLYSLSPAFIMNLVASILALVLTVLRFFRPNIIVQNLSEIFIYGGLAAVFVPILNIFAVSMLLIVISIYDYIAVFKTKHMIKMAEFQSKSNVFSGIMIPYQRQDSKEKSRVMDMAKASAGAAGRKSKGDLASPGSLAVVGGGDVGFTLLFAGVVMKELMLKEFMLTGFLIACIIPIFVTLSLMVLLIKGQQNKFYPAMPVLSAGCFIGYLVVWLI